MPVGWLNTATPTLTTGISFKSILLIIVSVKYDTLWNEIILKLVQSVLIFLAIKKILMNLQSIRHYWSRQARGTIAYIQRILGSLLR